MKAYFLAARPKTLPAAIVPVWLGCALAYHLSGKWDPVLAGLTLLGAVMIQIGTNFFNDAIDADKGADTDARLGPKRATASGLLPRKTVYLSALVSLLLAAVCGYFLIEARGWPILLIGLASLYFAYGYTGGPFPLAYKGLGELFVILFFGLVAVGGTYFVQTGEWPRESILLGLAVGCLSAVLISVNNLRDMDEDRENYKKTLAVRWGRAAGVNLVRCMTITAYACAILLLDTNLQFLWLVPAFLIGMTIIHGLTRHEPSAIYNKFLALAALQLIVFAVVFHLAIAL